jgi:carbon storage regulator
MLVLSRKVGEQICIGGGIVVHVKRIKSDRVSLGIDAPRQLPVMRGELSNELQPSRDRTSGISQHQRRKVQ